jgi:branched-chain amino acid transport system substrate-binding protein
MLNRLIRLSLVAAVGVTLSHAASAQKKYDTGATDQEIKIGQTYAYSGPASAYGTIGRVEAAYFNMINEKGGINGRKINLISLDDGYSPPKTVEQTRKLIEQDQVLFIFNTLGTPTNTAIQKYLNSKKIPQLFLATGADKWNDPKHFPWTMGWQPSYRAEAQIFGKYILANKPDGKVGVLYQNDDFGKDYVKGLKEALGDKYGKMVIKEVSYEVTDPTIDSQIVSLQESGADVFVNVTTPKFAAQAIRKVYDIGWKPLHILTDVSISVASVMKPAGLEKGVGILTALYQKDPTDPQWQNDAAYKDWAEFMKKYYPEGDINDVNNVYGYNAAMTMVDVLKRCGDDLTRANVMKKAAELNLQLPMLLPGIKLTTSATDFAPIKSQQMARFDGTIWKPIGEVLTASER